MNRRKFIAQSAALAALSISPSLPAAQKKKTLLASRPPQKPEDLFEISVSQWSYHRAMFGNARDDYPSFIKTLHSSEPDRVLNGSMDPRDIIAKAVELEVSVVDLVNILWFGKGSDRQWLSDFKTRAADNGVRFGVLMCDELGNLGASKAEERQMAIEKHIRWMDTAVALGSPYFRVNPYGEGSYLEQCQRCSESFYILGEAAAERELDVLVENHGHPGGIGAWLNMLLEMTNHPCVGAFADFDNFFMGGWDIDPQRRYDRTQGMLDLAPWTWAVSAKSFDFDVDGEETKIDFTDCLRIALSSGRCNLVSAEYEGEHLSEDEGTRKTVELLRSSRQRLFEEVSKG